MKKVLKWVGLGVLVLGAMWAAIFFIKSIWGICGWFFFINSNSKSAITYETHTPFISSIEKKTVATGKVIPQEEVEIKPQISGIIDKIFKEEGESVEAGDLSAVNKVEPNEQSLYAARGRVNNAEIALNNT